MKSKSFLENLRDTAPELYSGFVTYLSEHTIDDTAKKYALQFRRRQSQVRLIIINGKRAYSWFKRDLEAGKAIFGNDPPPAQIPPRPKKIMPTFQPESAPAALAPPTEILPGQLTEDELQFLQNFRSGEIGFEQVQREFAYRVLHKVLQDPTLLKVSDWLKSEVIKIQREEMNLKREQMERSWAMIFGGFDFPRSCPRCGFDLQPKATSPLDESLNGEIVGEEEDVSESVGTSRSVSH